MMTKARAQEIARGYMSPRNNGINVFAQTGRVSDQLLCELDVEMGYQRNIVQAIGGNAAEAESMAELAAMLEVERLDHLVTWLTVTGAIVSSINGS